MMKKILTGALVVLVTASAWAIPARPGQWKTIKLSDGSEVRVELKGDEHNHYWQAEDGRVFNAFSIEEGSRRFQEVSEGSRGLQEVSEGSRGLQEVSEGSRGLQEVSEGSRGLQEVAAAPAKVLGVPHKEPIAGTMKGLVVLVQFSDVKFKSGHDKALYEKVLNERDYKDATLGFQGSVNDYFYDQSNQQLDYQFDVKGPVTLSKTATYYGGESGFDNMKEFVAGVLELIKADTDFSIYDNDGDRYVDEIFFVFAGKGANDGGTNCIWPHMYWYKSWGGSFKQNRTWVDRYACANEVQENGSINGIGPFCHEFSHCLDIPDMYDTVAGENPLGKYSLMDTGCYNGSTYVPAGYNAYEKEFCGWNKLVELDMPAQYNNVKSISDGGVAYKMTNKAKPDEYFILEPRSKTSWDACIPSAGFLFYHVDYTQPTDWLKNVVNTVSTNSTGHYNLARVSGVEDLYYANVDGTKNLHKGVYDMTMNADGTFSFRYECDPEYTGIEEVWSGLKGLNGSKGSRFNVAGQRVCGSYKGLQIVGGKKVIN